MSYDTILNERNQTQQSIWFHFMRNSKNESMEVEVRNSGYAKYWLGRMEENILYPDLCADYTGVHVY